MDIRLLADQIQKETEKIIVGKSHEIRLVIMAVFAGGHVLLEDLPGVGKTTLVKTITRTLGCDFGRIQFVPDLLPSDILGMQIYNQKLGDFQLRPGPVMTNLLLADELNRAIPRTQSALLEVMEEYQVSIDGTHYPVPEPFVVLATQNPVESESTFQLPAAQLDRFLLRLELGYPDAGEERRMLTLLGDEIPFAQVQSVTSPKEILLAQKAVQNVHVSEAVMDYMIRLADATRNHKALKLGVSPRGTRSLYRASKVWAAMEGRDYVTPDDVQALALPVLAHRMMLSSSARLSGQTTASVLRELLETTVCMEQPL